MLTEKLLCEKRRRKADKRRPIIGRRARSIEATGGDGAYQMGRWLRNRMRDLRVKDGVTARQRRQEAAGKGAAAFGITP